MAERPTIRSVVGTKRPVKPWHTESQTDTYGVYYVDDVNEACVETLLKRDKDSVVWINALDYFISNAISLIPVMIAMLYDIKDEPDLSPEMKNRVFKLLARLDSTPLYPEVKLKKKRRNDKNSSSKAQDLLGKLLSPEDGNPVG